MRDALLTRHFALNKHAGHIHSQYGEKTNEHYIYNKIPLFFQKLFNQSMNNEYMNDEYKTIMYCLHFESLG